MTPLSRTLFLKAATTAIFSCAFLLPSVAGYAAPKKDEIIIKGMNAQDKTPPPATYQPAPLGPAVIDTKSFKPATEDPFDALPPQKPEQQGYKAPATPSAADIPSMFLDEKSRKPIRLSSVELDKADIEPYLVNVLGDYGINIVMDARAQQVTPDGAAVNSCVLNLRLRDVELWHTVNLITKMCGLKLELDDQNHIVRIFHPSSAMAIAPYTGKYEFKYLQVASHLNDNYIRVTGSVQDGGGQGNKVGISSLKEIVEVILGVRKGGSTSLTPIGGGIGTAAPGEPVPVLLPDSEAVAINEATNSVVIRGEEGKVKEAIRVLEEMDRPAPQVKIQAWIIETEASTAKQIGIRWSGKFSFDNGIAWGGSRDLYDGATNAFRYPLRAIEQGTMPLVTEGSDDKFTHETESTPYNGNLYSLGMGVTTDAGSLVAEMQALESSGDIEILSQPELTVQDNREATITAGRNIYAWYENQDGTSLKEIPAKLIATITPHVSPENNLMMRVTLQDKAAAEETVNGIPEVTERAIDTTLLARNGETIVLGGLKINKNERATDGVPYLKDLPVLGYIFRYEDDRKTTKELLMIIRPTIIPVTPRPAAHAPVTELNHTGIKE